MTTPTAYAYIPCIDNNPYQPTRRNYGDLLTFGREQIATELPNRPDTYGLQTIPQARLLINGQLVADPYTELQQRGLLVTAPPAPNAIGEMGQPLTEKFLRSFHRTPPIPGIGHNPEKLLIQPLFGHRRKGALWAMHEAGDAGYTGWMPLQFKQATDEQMLREVYIENAGRKNPAAAEELEILEASMAMGGNLRQAAERVGGEKYYSRARSLWQLRNLPEYLMEANASGQLPQSHLEELLPALRVEPHINLPNTRFVPAEEWLDERRPRWNNDIPLPSIYAQSIIGNPPSKTAVREYVATLRGRGFDLPAEVRETDVDDSSPAILQPSCTRCPARLSDACLNKPCLLAKSRALATAHWERNLSQYPWSDDEQHFARMERNWNTRNQFAEFIKAHPDDPSLVIGFRMGSESARPGLLDQYISYNPSRPPEQGLAYGYTAAKLPTAAQLSASGQALTPADEKTELEERLKGYRAEAKQILKRWCAECHTRVSRYLQFNSELRLRVALGVLLDRSPEYVCATLVASYLPDEKDVSEVTSMLDVALALHDKMTALDIAIPTPLDPEQTILLVLGSMRLDHWRASHIAKTVTGQIETHPLLANINECQRGIYRLDLKNLLNQNKE